MQNGKESKLGSILLGIGAVCVVLRLVTKGPGWTLGAVVFLLVGAIVDGASRKRYQREVRGPLFHVVFQHFHQSNFSIYLIYALLNL